MLITITEDDIVFGEDDLFTCDPVERAVRRATGASVVNVGLDRILVKYEPGRRPARIPTPPLVRDWLIRFDTGLPVRPFEFELAAAHPRDKEETPDDR